MSTIKTFSLCVVLIYLHLAHSDKISSKSKCRKLIPTIGIETNNTFYNSIFDKRKRVSVKYGDMIKVTCAGNVTRLTLMKDGEIVLTENEEISIFSMIKPDRPISKFVCTDSGTGCQRTVNMSIAQVVKVISGNAEISKRNGTYSIQYGSSLEVICSGLGRFVITKNGQGLAIEQNGTTIKWFENKPNLQSQFVCSSVDTSLNTSVIIRVVPLMSIRSRNETVKIKYHEGDTPVYPVIYTDDFEVFCSGETTRHIVADNKISREYVNETTIKGFISHFDKTGLIINCIGEPDYVSTVKVVAKPQVYITSPRMRRIGQQFVVKYGDQVEIFCSAPNAKKLIMVHHHDLTNVKRLISISVNETTIKYVIDKSEILVNYGHNLYGCTLGKVLGRVVVELFPEVQNFRCMSYNGQYMNCTWIALNHVENVTLSYIENGIPIHICLQNVVSPGLMFYVWHQDQYPSGYKNYVAELEFVLQSCSYFGCFNQTFVVDHISVVKLSPPRKLKVNGTSSRTVKLRWDTTFIRLKGEKFTSSNGGVVHKVEYWYSGIQPLEANSSMIACTSWYCEIELKLPCPGQSYEVWIYRKLARVGEEFWSEPSSVTFFTDTDNDKTHVVDEVCTQKPRKTKEVMIYFVQELRENVRLEMRQMKGSMFKSLHDKRGKIRAYLDKY